MTALGGQHHIGSTHWRLTAAATMTAAALAAGLTGCGANGGAKDPATKTAGSSAASSPSSSAAGSPGKTSLKTVTTDGVQIQVPADWHVSQQPNGPAGSAPPPSGSSISPAVFSLGSAPDPLGTTDSAAKTALRNAGKTGKRLSDLHVNGATLYHVQYQTGGSFRDDFGTIVDGVAYHMTWNFTTVEGITRAAADKYMNPVMATFKLTS